MAVFALRAQVRLRVSVRACSATGCVAGMVCAQRVHAQVKVVQTVHVAQKEVMSFLLVEYEVTRAERVSGPWMRIIKVLTYLGLHGP